MADSATVDYVAEITGQKQVLDLYIAADQTHKSFLGSPFDLDTAGLTIAQVREAMDSHESVILADLAEAKQTFDDDVKTRGVSYFAATDLIPKKDTKPRAKQNREARKSAENSLTKVGQTSQEITDKVNADSTVTVKVDADYVGSVLTQLKQKDRASSKGRASDKVWTSFVPSK